MKDKKWIGFYAAADAAWTEKYLAAQAVEYKIKTEKSEVSFEVLLPADEYYIEDFFSTCIADGSWWYCK